jgi:hypothetical protein
MGKIRVLGVSFFTESERSGERLPKAASRVSGNESINRIHKILAGLDRMTGFSGVTGWGRHFHTPEFILFTF